METVENRTVIRISVTPLFNQISKHDIQRILQDPRVTFATFRKNEVIYQPKEYRKSLVFLLKGKAQVKSSAYEMRTITAGHYFGAAALFTDEEDYVSEVTALNQVSLLFFEESLLEECIRTLPQFALNYTRFLVSRIHFLNRKISLLGSPSSKNSLVHFLLLWENESTDGFELPMSYLQLAKNLNISRASLYRIMSEMEEQKIIERNGKIINILDPDALKAYAK